MKTNGFNYDIFLCLPERELVVNEKCGPSMEALSFKDKKTIFPIRMGKCLENELCTLKELGIQGKRIRILRS